MSIKCKRIRDSAVSIATRYGLDGPGIESRWGGGRDFLHLSRPAQWPTQPPIQWGVKQPEHSIDHPPPSSVKVKETVGLYLFSLSGPLWSVLGWTLPLPYKMWEVRNCLELVKSCTCKIHALNYDPDCWVTIYSEFLFSPPWRWPHEWLKHFMFCWPCILV
jgi:hypothetical protein